MRKIVFGLALLSATSSFAQWNPYGVTYLGASYNFAGYKGNPAAFSNNYYTTGEVKVSSRPLAMVSRFNSLGKGTKIGFGFYGGLDLGASMTKWTFRNTGGVVDNVNNSSLELFIDLRFGFQGAYKIPEKQFLAGMRYFYHAMGDGVRSSFTNNDEGNAIGLFAAYKKLGVDFTFSSEAIPGIMIENNWNITELELRYKLGTWDEDNYSWLAGLRLEHSKMNAGWVPGGQSLKTNMLMLFFAMGTN